MCLAGLMMLNNNGGREETVKDECGHPAVLKQEEEQRQETFWTEEENGPFPFNLFSYLGKPPGSPPSYFCQRWQRHIKMYFNKVFQNKVVRKYL